MANDSKYGRVYPERAVASARVLLEKLAPKSAQAKIALDALDRLGFPENEPIFPLRAQDVLAATTVRRYHDEVAISEAFGGRGSKEQRRVLAHLRHFADQMERWQPRKLPD